MTSDIVERLNKRFGRIEDMALDFRDIGGRNADAKADECEALARELRDAASIITARSADVQLLAKRAHDLEEQLQEWVDHFYPPTEDPWDAEEGTMLANTRALLGRRLSRATDKEEE